MQKGKVYRGTLYKTDGSIEILTPANGKKFEYPELQKAVGGYIESLIAQDPRCKQMYCNEEGLLLNLPPDPQVAAGEWKIEMQAPPCDDVTHNVQVLFPKRSGEPITIECDAMPVGEK